MRKMVLYVAWAAVLGATALDGVWAGALLTVGGGLLGVGVAIGSVKEFAPAAMARPMGWLASLLAALLVTIGLILLVS